MDFQTMLRYLGVPIRTTTYMFGDNQAVVNNSAIPHSCLSKQHNVLSYHRVCEAIAAKVVNYFWIDGKNNPAHIIS
jgi:hypothetical protein